MPAPHLHWKTDILDPFRDIIGQNGIITTDDLFGDQPDNDDPSDRRLHDPVEVRSLIFGDTHFRSELSCAPELVRFLNHIKFVAPQGRRPFIGINGDFIEGRKRDGSLSNAESVVVQKVLRASRKGTDVVITPGNHDPFFHDLADTFVTPNMAVKKRIVHQTLTGENLLIEHTDNFDLLVRSRTLEWVGTQAKERLAKMSVAFDNLKDNAVVNRMFGALGMGKGWSLAHAILGETDGASYGERYIEATTAYLHAVNAEIYHKHKQDPNNFKPDYIHGMVGNHTHVATKRTFSSPLNPVSGEFMGPPLVTYYNTGHWTQPPSGSHAAEREVRSPKYPALTALVEFPDGRLDHVQWVPNKGIIQLAIGSELSKPVARMLPRPAQARDDRAKLAG